jgi:hypothetical protein
MLADCHDNWYAYHAKEKHEHTRARESHPDPVSIVKIFSNVWLFISKLNMSPCNGSTVFLRNQNRRSWGIYAGWVNTHA